MKRNLWSSVVVLSMFFVLFFAFTTSSVFAYSASVNPTVITQGGCTTLSWSGFGDTCEIWVYKGTTQWVDANLNAPYQGTQNICTSGWEIRNDYKIRVQLKSNPTIYVYTQTFEVKGLVPQVMDMYLNGGAASTTNNVVYIQHWNSVTTPTHYMASENSNFSGATWQAYTPDPISFTLSAGAGMKFVYFKYKNAYGESDPVWDNISYEPIMYYDISGYVLDEGGQGANLVTISGFPGGGVATTNSTGYYKVEDIVSTWSGTITPSKTGYTFSPASKTFSGLTGNTTQNFTAISNVTYSWQTGDYGPCNDTCGGGRKIRVVQCIRSTDGQVVNDSYCTDTKPESISYDCPELGPSRLINDLGGEMYE